MASQAVEQFLLPVLMHYSSGSRPGHKVSGKFPFPKFPFPFPNKFQSKFPNLNENGQKSHFL